MLLNGSTRVSQIATSPLSRREFSDYGCRQVVSNRLEAVTKGEKKASVRAKNVATEPVKEQVKTRDFEAQHLTSVSANTDVTMHETNPGSGKPRFEENNRVLSKRQLRRQEWRRRQIVRPDVLGTAIVFVTGSNRQKREFIDALDRREESVTVSQLNEAATAMLRLHRINDAYDFVQMWEEKPLLDILDAERSVKTQTIMIDVYGKARKLLRALSIFYNITQLGLQPNVITYNSMIAACARNNEPKLASRIFDEMRDRQLKPDKFTFGSLIDSCAKGGHVEKAFEMARLMDTLNVKKDEAIYSALMDACGRANQLERALYVFEEMKRDGVWPNLVTFAVLIGTCASVREPEIAFELFSEMKHWGYGRGNVIVYTALLDACAKSGWPERAELVMDVMIKKGVKPNQVSFGALMEGWTREGRIDRAFSVVDRMITIHGLAPNVILVGGLIDACKRRREYSHVTRIWSIVVQNKIRPGTAHYPALIAMGCKVGNLDVASAIALHAYARGSLRKVSLGSEYYTARNLALAIACLYREIKKSGLSDAAKDIYDGRLRAVFNGTAMGSEDMEKVDLEMAYERCLYTRSDRSAGKSSPPKQSVHGGDMSRA